MRFTSLKSGLVAAVGLAALMVSPAVARETRAKAPAAASSQVAKAATTKAATTKAATKKVATTKAATTKAASTPTKSAMATRTRPAKPVAAPAVAKPAVAAAVVPAAAAIGSQGIGAQAIGDVTINSCSFTNCSVSGTDSETLIAFSETPLATPTFSELISFNNALDGIYSITLGTTDIGVNFTDTFLSALGLDGMATGPRYDLIQTANSGSVEQRALFDTFLAAGTYGLFVNGTNSGGGNAGGTISIRQAAAVPEPGTWAMMLLGFGGMGVAMRRRRRTGNVMQQMA